MKRRIEAPPKIPLTHSAAASLEQHLARQTAQLRQVSRFLQTVSVWNRKLVRATEALVRSIAHDTEHAGAKLKVRQQLAELRARYDSLTPREREVMGLVVKGLLNKQTAARLGTAEITVKIHRANAMKKMKAASVADLVRMAEKLRILAD